MNNHFTGAKYDRALSIVEIAKLVRIDIKAAVKAGSLPERMKISVRVRKPAGCQSLDIEIKSAPRGIVNPDFVRAWNEKPGLALTEYPPRYQSEVSDAIAELERIANEYNFNRDDAMTDYFNSNFFLHVGPDVEIVATATRAIEDTFRSLEIPK